MSVENCCRCAYQGKIVPARYIFASKNHKQSKEPICHEHWLHEAKRKEIAVLCERKTNITIGSDYTPTGKGEAADAIARDEWIFQWNRFYHKLLRRAT